MLKLEKMFQAIIHLALLKCWLSLVFCSSMALEEPTDTNIVFVRENSTATLQWPLFIGENTGTMSLTVKIKKRDALLCKWVNAHGESNRCDAGMSLTITPNVVRVPGPTNLTAAFSFNHKGRDDDGTYECHFLIDEKWDAVQIHRINVTTIAEPNVTLHPNVSASNTAITCRVSGGIPRPVETILIKNGTEVSRRLCQKDVNDTDDSGKCFLFYTVGNSGGRYKCRATRTLPAYVVDSAAVDLRGTTKVENANYIVAGYSAVAVPSKFAVLAIPLIVNALALVY